MSFVISKRFGNSVIHIVEQRRQPLLSTHEDIFNTAHLLFFSVIPVQSH